MDVRSESNPTNVKTVLSKHTVEKSSRGAALLELGTARLIVQRVCTDVRSKGLSLIKVVGRILNFSAVPLIVVFVQLLHENTCIV